MDEHLKAGIHAEVISAIKLSQGDLLNSFTNLIDARLEIFQRNISESQKSMNDAQMARIDESLASEYKFKKRGNEKQYRHNNKVFVKLREASIDLEGITAEKTGFQNALYRPGKCFMCGTSGHWRKDCLVGSDEAKETQAKINHIEHDDVLIQSPEFVSYDGIVTGFNQSAVEVRLRSRYIYDCILFQASWEAYVPISSKAVEELKFWFDNLNEHISNNVLDSGISMDSQLYKLYPKMGQFLLSSKVTILSDLIFMVLDVGRISLPDMDIVLYLRNQFMFLCI
ncbi:hypothetical protein KUTeg_000310 [Tegillarca granosa]|uniref:CCHC-type domain-containing protein n=1 Tax=Tegillarca granosa TaxID=220873 RepID=A0ABQ9FXA3_TEGGR|nr:hypothetical protein KUTeg_000310 [Tegillarca granosa]